MIFALSSNTEQQPVQNNTHAQQSTFEIQQIQSRNHLVGVPESLTLEVFSSRLRSHKHHC